MSVYDDKDTVFVTPFNGATVKYAWQTNIDAADRTALGQKAISTLTGIAVAGTSRPKPARMSRQRATGTTSSFVDHGSFNAAKAAGWKQSRGYKAGPAPRSSTRSVRVYAEAANGLNVAWDMRQTQFTKIGAANLATMGIATLTEGAGVTAVTGANSYFGATIYGAVNPGVDDTLSVGYVDIAAVDSLPDGWSAVIRNASADPTISPVPVAE
ncbi:hypothetical protein [cf. Phormidesmis sp. LEGE 11477]|uniref:hypothetical protein n=1 Tax=cf. Phormidesmis sp. LEGE 11477 TaxID=1828680 RepID=UPI0018807B75|nr:hypothetical protein [cf. Phormidesmis sp. LEGE 11477]MBE9061857.1 hypothetical protein [cf. Phormidesmis sp. LEGE 11477]